MNLNTATRKLNRILIGYPGELIERKLSDIKFYIRHGALLSPDNLELFRSGRLDPVLSSIITPDVIRNSETRIAQIKELLTNGKFNFDNISFQFEQKLGLYQSERKLDIVINWLFDNFEYKQLDVLTQIFLKHSDEDITSDATRLSELLGLDIDIAELKGEIYRFKHRFDMVDDPEITLNLDIQKLKELVTKGRLSILINYSRIPIPPSELLNRILYNIANDSDNMNMNITEGLTYLIQNGAILNEYVIHNVLDRLDSTEHGREALSIIHSSDLVNDSLMRLNMLKNLIPDLNTNEVEEFIDRIMMRHISRTNQLIREYNLIDKTPELIEILRLNPVQLIEDANQTIRDIVEHEIGNRTYSLDKRTEIINNIMSELNNPISTSEEVKKIVSGVATVYVDIIFDNIRIRTIATNYIRQKERQTKERQHIQAQRQRQSQSKRQIQERQSQAKRRSQERQRKQSQERQRRQSQERQSQAKRRLQERQRQSLSKHQLQERQQKLDLIRDMISDEFIYNHSPEQLDIIMSRLSNYKSYYELSTIIDDILQNFRGSNMEHDDAYGQILQILNVDPDLLDQTRAQHERQRKQSQERQRRQSRERQRRQSRERQRRQSQERQRRQSQKRLQLQEMNARFRTYLTMSQPKSEQIRADVSKLKPEVVKTVDAKSLANWTQLNNAWKEVTGNPNAVFNDQEIKKEIMLIKEDPKVDISTKQSFFELLDVLMQEFNSRMINGILFEASNYRNRGSVRVERGTPRQTAETAETTETAQRTTGTAQQTTERSRRVQLEQDVVDVPRHRGMELAGIRPRSRL